MSILILMDNQTGPQSFLKLLRVDYYTIILRSSPRTPWAQKVPIWSVNNIFFLIKRFINLQKKLRFVNVPSRPHEERPLAHMVSLSKVLSNEETAAGKNPSKWTGHRRHSWSYYSISNHFNFEIKNFHVKCSFKIWCNVTLYSFRFAV